MSNALWNYLRRTLAIHKMMRKLKLANQAYLSQWSTSYGLSVLSRLMCAWNKNMSSLTPLHNWNMSLNANWEWTDILLKYVEGGRILTHFQQYVGIIMAWYRYVSKDTLKWCQHDLKVFQNTKHSRQEYTDTRPKTTKSMPVLWLNNTLNEY